MIVYPYTINAYPCMTTACGLLAVSIGHLNVTLEDVQCQLNSSNASHLIIALVCSSQYRLSLDVFIAIMKLANALLDEGNTTVQVGGVASFV